MITLVVSILAAAFAPPPPPNPCGGVATLAVPGMRITSATAEGPSSTALPEGSPRIRAGFCRVQAVVDDSIGIELWLPAKSAWNRRLLTGGVGGQGGYFNYRVLGRAVNNGYLGASTDTGHKRGTAHWMLNNPAAVENFVERAHHRLAETARAVADTHYGAPVSRAIFLGCSGAGRQGLIEAQRYPTDYDGIIVGAPGPKTAEMSARRLWEMIQHRRFGERMSQPQWDLIAQRAVAACDADDGLRDGIVTDPRECRFKVASLTCKPGEAGECLTPAQVQAAQILYGPMRDENGTPIDPGLLPTMRIQHQPLPLPGEAGKNVIALAIFGDLIHRDPDWDAMRFRITDDLPKVDAMARLSPRDPVLDRFAGRGGKIIFYHGWSDEIVDPLMTIDYYQAVARHTRTPASRFARLFMVPAMKHCSGGDGVDQFGADAGDPPVIDARHDMLVAMERWLDGGPAPETFVASRVEQGRIVSQRPLCAYPRRERYTGKGPPSSAASFECALPETPGPHR